MTPIQWAMRILEEPYFVGRREPNGQVTNLSALRRSLGSGYRVPSGFRTAMRKFCTYTPVELPEWRDPTND